MEEGSKDKPREGKKEQQHNRTKWPPERQRERERVKTSSSPETPYSSTKPQDSEVQGMLPHDPSKQVCEAKQSRCPRAA